MQTKNDLKDQKHIQEISNRIPKLFISDIYNGRYDKQRKKVYFGDYYFKQIALLGEITYVGANFFDIDDYTSHTRVYVDSVNCVENTGNKSAVLTAADFVEYVKKWEYKIMDLVQIVGKMNFYNGYMNIFGKSLQRIDSDVGEAKLDWLSDRDKVIKILKK